MPQPNTHLRTGATGHTPADPAWAAWDRAWTRHLPMLTGRTDLTVVVAPGAGGGAPACFYPDTRRIEVDAIHIGTPTITDPRRAGHKKLVPTAYGALVHEAAHAAHSHWRTPDGTPLIVAHVAHVLEESRAEARQRTRRRGDRRWLRHTVQTLVAPDDAPIDDAWHAGQVAGLLLARVDARILTSKDVRAARVAVSAVLGRKPLTQLRQVWREAHTVDDNDADTMIDLAWRWCRILGIDPHRQPEPPRPNTGVFPGRLAAAISDYLAHAAGLTPAEYTTHMISRRHTAPASWTQRHPNAQEQQAARTLATRLQRARINSLDEDARPAPVPPGRLRTRAAITAHAQITAGQIPTAQPWQRRTHLPPPKPKLHLAVLVDMSASMRPYTRPMSAAGWILAHAARRADAVTTTIAFADTVTLLVPPRQRPTHVQEMRAFGGTSTFTDAVKLADQLLDLRRPRTVRMLAVVSDGDLPDREPAQRLITTLHHHGCAVLWLRPADLRGHTYNHTTTITITDPVEAITHIADAATTALTTA